MYGAPPEAPAVAQPELPKGYFPALPAGNRFGALAARHREEAGEDPMPLPGIQPQAEVPAAPIPAGGLSENPPANTITSVPAPTAEESTAPPPVTRRPGLIRRPRGEMPEIVRSHDGFKRSF